MDKDNDPVELFDLYVENLLLTEVFMGMTPHELDECEYDRIMTHFELWLGRKRAERLKQNKPGTTSSGSFGGSGG